MAVLYTKLGKLTSATLDRDEELHPTHQNPPSDEELAGWFDKLSHEDRMMALGVAFVIKHEGAVPDDFYDNQQK